VPGRSTPRFFDAPVTSPTSHRTLTVTTTNGSESPLLHPSLTLVDGGEYAFRDEQCGARRDAMSELEWVRQLLRPFLGRGVCGRRHLVVQHQRWYVYLGCGTADQSVRPTCATELRVPTLGRLAPAGLFLTVCRQLVWSSGSGGGKGTAVTIRLYWADETNASVDPQHPPP
jgi:hypothetical protein